jgi:hypothetical protein
MNERIKAKELFQKGMDLYNEKKFEPAYKLFAESLRLDYKESTEIYMIRCKKQMSQNGTAGGSKSASQPQQTTAAPSGDPEKVE